MLRRQDGRFLKTKIVATMGAAHENVFNPDSDLIKHFKTPEDFWDTYLNWFFEQDHFLIDTLRLNMSFYRKNKPATADNVRQILAWLRRNPEKTWNVAVLGDLPGPKVRLGGTWKPRWMKLNESIGIRLAPGRGVSTPFLVVGDTPLIERDRNTAALIRRKLHADGGLTAPVGDGGLEVEISALKEDGVLQCRVKKEGPISSGKGFTFKGVPFNFESFGSLDREALDFLLDEGIDWSRGLDSVKGPGSVLAFIGLSFVKHPDDVVVARRAIEEGFFRRLRKCYPAASLADEHLRREARLLCPSIIAKFETPEAVVPKTAAAILDYADGVMVARGDLAHQIGEQNVPAVQKRLIRLCNLRGKPVITATQMLLSMQKNREPTRAEASDVFNAIIDGTDAVMLSEETAVGDYPFQAVKTMATIAEAAEIYAQNLGQDTEPTWEERRRASERWAQEVLDGSEQVVKDAAARLKNALHGTLREGGAWRKLWLREELKRNANQLLADRITMTSSILSSGHEGEATIVAATITGRTARMIARFRPCAGVVGSAGDELNRRKMLLSRGICAVNRGSVSASTDDVFKKTCEEGKRRHLLRTGETCVFVAGTPLDEPGNTNLIEMKRVE